eukprot:148290_1
MVDNLIQQSMSGKHMIAQIKCDKAIAHPKNNTQTRLQKFSHKQHARHSSSQSVNSMRLDKGSKAKHPILRRDLPMPGIQHNKHPNKYHNTPIGAPPVIHQMTNVINPHGPL